MRYQDFWKSRQELFSIYKATCEEDGLKRALYDDPRPGSPKKIDDSKELQIIALVCSDPPEGFDRWTLSLIQKKSIEEGLVKSISKSKIRVILEEHDVKPWRQKSWCVPKLDDPDFAVIVLNFFKFHQKRLQAMHRFEIETFLNLEAVCSVRYFSLRGVQRKKLVL